MSSPENIGKSALLRVLGGGVAVNAAFAIVAATLLTIALVFSLERPLPQ